MFHLLSCRLLIYNVVYINKLGDTNMSVVNIIIHDSCALMMSDTKLNNNSQNNMIKKIFKKENILLGFTGSIQDVFDYLSPIFNENMTLNIDYPFGEPCDFLKFLDEKFYKALAQNKEYDIVFVVATKIGEKYVAKRYCLNRNEQRNLASDMIISTKNLQYFYLGEDAHLNYFDNLLMERIPNNLNDLVSIFQDTLNYGVLYDKTINNIIDIEYINSGNI